MDELEGHAATMASDWDADNINANEDDGKQWVPMTPQTMRRLETPRPMGWTAYAACNAAKVNDGLCTAAEPRQTG